MSQYPLVSVPVITYNSAKFIIETLESVKSQTYPNIELIVSDDGSMDGTVQLCRDWIEQNNSRFYRVKLLTVEHNTGTAGNMNRAEAECRGEWVKSIAGDDILIIDCISNCVQYVQTHADVRFLFGKISKIDVKGNPCDINDYPFDYSFFSLSSEEQLYRLVYQWNCIPASTFFYHRDSMKKICVRNDERIPLLEDWPKWINLLSKGAIFSFIDKPLVEYRVGQGLSTGIKSVRYYESVRKFVFYYKYPRMVEVDEDQAINDIVMTECELFEENSRLHKELCRLRSTNSYKLGKFLLSPISVIRRRLSKRHE